MRRVRRSRRNRGDSLSEILENRVLLSSARLAVIGDFGTLTSNEAEVAALVDSWNAQSPLDAVVTVGDNDQNVGNDYDRRVGQYYHQYIYNYSGAYGSGSATQRFLPAMGNHDWLSGGTPYTDFFTLPGNERYYDYTIGPVHIFVIDSDPNEPDGRTSDSIQAQWLQTQLGASTSPWNLVLYHHPAYTSATGHPSDVEMQAWPLKAWGADAVFSGHNHVYERVNVDGLRFITNGVGGQSSLDSFGTPIAGSEFRYRDNNGAQLIEADDSQIYIKFINRAGSLIDLYAMSVAPVPTVTISATDAAAAEPGDAATFRVSRSDSAGDLVVRYALGGTATAGSDYASLGGSVLIPNGQLSADIILTPIDDATAEEDETVTLTLANDPAYLVGMPLAATATIADDDLLSVSFQQGVSGYTGTVDTHLSQNYPSTSYATATELNVDSDEPPGTNNDVQALVRFDDIFGSSAGQIPAGATILSAALELQITNPGNSINLHRMLRSWSATDTWSAMGAGIQADGVEAVATADRSTGAIGATGKLSIDVTTSLVAWLANPLSNLGWVMLPTGTDGVDFYSSEGTTPPRLVVTYTPGGTPVANGDSYSVSEDGTLNVEAPGVLGNDTDPNGDPLSAVLVSGASNGVVSLSADGSFTYTPNADFNGIDSFSYTAVDSLGAVSSVATVTITVNSVNDAPVAVDDSFSGAEDALLTGNVLSNDSDVDENTLTASVLSGPASGLLAFNSDGSFAYTPNADWFASDSFTYQVSDGVGGTASATVTLTVSPVNDAPVAANDSFTTSEDTPLTIAAPGVLSNDSDIEGSALSAVLVALPANGSLVLNPDGSFTYTPNLNFAGTDTFIYCADDGSAASGDVIVTIEVTPINDAPVAADDSYSITQDSTLTVAISGVLANDSDPDNDPLTAVLVLGPTHGTLTLNVDGSFIYAPAAGYVGPDSFTYTAGDGALSSNIAAVLIDVQRTNTAPTVVDDAYTTSEDASLSVLGDSGVLANDSDLHGDPFTAVLNIGPANGILSLGDDGSFTYTPNANFNGIDSFSYTAEDSLGAVSSVATVTITVNSVNDAPVAVDDGFLGNEDVPFSGDVLSNDSDVDGNTLTATLLTGPANGLLEFVNGVFTYTPNADWSGSDTFTYQTSDGAGGQASATVTLTVNPVNDVPSAISDAASGDEDSVLSGDVLANDSDIDGNPLTASLVLSPANGVLDLNAGGSFTYTPASNWYGADSFTYQAEDGAGGLATATVSLTVSPVNDVPLAVDDSASVIEGNTLSGESVLANDSDVEGHVLGAALVAGPVNGALTLSSDGTYIYAPNAGYTGPDSFTYTAVDSVGAMSNVATVTITVNPAGTDDYAVAESITFGTASGLGATLGSDDVRESIQEQVYGKNKNRLSHTWEFNITGGSAVRFYLEAHHNSVDETFLFDYSLDRIVWTPMVTLTKTSDDNGYQTFDLPASVSGRVYVRVLDSNAADTVGRDTVYVDHMFFRSFGSAPLPVVSITASDPNASEAGADPGEFTVTRTGSTAGDLVVDYVIDSGSTATNGIDYGTLSGRVTIPAGSSSATFSVTPIDDTTVEGSEAVILSVASSAGYTVGTGSATVTIADDDAAPTAPAAPSGLLAAAASSSQINLNWTDNSSNEDGFRIERSTDGINFTEIQTVGAGVTGYSDTGLAASTAYTYRVRAFNAVGVSDYSDVASVTTQPAVVAPAAPANLTGAVTQKTKVKLTWLDNSTDESGFKVYASSDGVIWSLYGDTIGARNGTGGTVQFTTAPLAKGTWYFRVSAFNAGGESAFSNVVTVTV